MAQEIKLFGKWAYEGLAVGDITVEDYIAVRAKDSVSPNRGAASHTGARCSCHPARREYGT
jgi:hypothetical protein